MIEDLLYLYGDSYINMNPLKKKQLENLYRANRDLFKLEVANKSTKRLYNARKSLQLDINIPIAPTTKISPKKKASINIENLQMVDESGLNLNNIDLDTYMLAVTKGSPNATPEELAYAKQLYFKNANNLEFLSQIADGKGLNVNISTKQIRQQNPELTKVFLQYGITDSDTLHKLYEEYAKFGGDFNEFMKIWGNKKVNANGIFNASGVEQDENRKKLEGAIKMAKEYGAANGINTSTEEGLNKAYSLLKAEEYMNSPEYKALVLYETKKRINNSIAPTILGLGAVSAGIVPLAGAFTTLTGTANALTGLGGNYLVLRLWKDSHKGKTIGDSASDWLIEHGYMADNDINKFYSSNLADAAVGAGVGYGTGYGFKFLGTNGIPTLRTFGKNLRTAYRNLTKGGLPATKMVEVGKTADGTLILNEIPINLKMLDVAMVRVEPGETFMDPELTPRIRMDSRTPGIMINRGGVGSPNPYRTGRLLFPEIDSSVADYTVSPNTENPFVLKRFRMMRPYTFDFNASNISGNNGMYGGLFEGTLE